MPKDYAKPPAVRKFPRMSDNSKTGQLKFGFSPKKPQNSSPSSRAPRGRVRQEFSQKLKNVKSQVEQDLFNAAPIAKQVPVAKEAQQLPVSNNNKKDYKLTLTKMPMSRRPIWEHQLWISLILTQKQMCFMFPLHSFASMIFLNVSLIEIQFILCIELSHAQNISWK